jgi:hypothetical protein
VAWHVILAISLATLGIVTSATSQPRAILTTTTCDAANPYDSVPDDAALQGCLDNFDQVLLQPDTGPGSHRKAGDDREVGDDRKDNYVGYLVGHTLKLRRDGVLLSSVREPYKATLRATPELAALILRASGVNNYGISFVRFDGDSEERTVKNRPCSAIHDYRNVELSGVGYHVMFVESSGAVCGSAMTVGGSSGFEISSSFFYNNGRQPEEADGVTGLWADGLNVFGCNDSTIRDNVFWDNTDVDLGVNGGSGCSVHGNSISHSWKYAFAGLVAGDPTRLGGDFSDNHVWSGYNLLGFGILVGCHPWSQCRGGYASNVSVHGNTSMGAVVNLAVDGLNGGAVEDNVMGFPGGDRVMNCNRAENYTVGHAINVSHLQAGYVVRTYDAGSRCQ